MTIYASESTTQTTDPDVDATEVVDETTSTPEVVDPEVIDPEPEPEAEPGDTLPAVIDTTSGTQAGPDKWVHPDPKSWQHDWLDFYGERIAIRVPSKSALVGLEMGSARGPELAMRAFVRFVSQHVSTETFDRLVDRSLDPEDPAAQSENGVFGSLSGDLGRIAGEKLTKEAEALAAVKNGQVRKGK